MKGIPGTLQGGGTTFATTHWSVVEACADETANCVFQEALFGSGSKSVVYAEFGENLIEVTATDTAGDASAPATFTIFF